jgi:hypothetical protein
MNKYRGLSADRYGVFTERRTVIVYQIAALAGFAIGMTGGTMMTAFPREGSTL